MNDKKRLILSLILASVCVSTVAYADTSIISSNYQVKQDDNTQRTFSSLDLRLENKIALFADNPTTSGCLGRPQRGSSYWTTSNIREWLNSDKTTVGYTSNPPSSTYMGGDKYAYDKEAGFLTNFTKEEQNAIAITERRVWVQDMDSIARDGGGGTSGHANIYGPGFLSNYSWIAYSYKNYGYKKERDKVFLLSPFEAYWYLNRRDFSYNRPLTQSAKNKNGTTASLANWWLTGGTQWQDWDSGYYAQVSSQLVYYSDVNANLGVVPAIHIKPNFKFADGRLASSLKIGDTVSFGRYLGETINWQVINITDSGYPLLLSSNVLDLKKFDAQGDQSKVYSEHINFGAADVSIFNDVQYKTITGHSDIDLPIVKILNEDQLGVRQNNSFVLNIEVQDSGSGIDYSVLPDGRIVKENNFQITATENKKYVIKVKDKAGNFLNFVIPISNINASPVVDVKQSTTEWTNKDVQINVTTSNNVSQLFNFGLDNVRKETAGGAFPNYISYVGKEFKVTGKIKLLYVNDIALNSNSSVGIGFHYKTRGKNSYTYTVSGSWNGVYSVALKDLNNSTDKTIPFTFNWVVPSNYAESLSMWINMGPSQVYGKCAEVQLIDMKYQLVDDSDFAITEITLPNGTSYKNNSYIGYISEEGIRNHTYNVVDNRNKTTTKTITTKIDKTLPTISVQKLDTSDSSKQNFSVTYSDSLSALSQITYPGKTENLSGITSKTSTFSVTENGRYPITATDRAGNVKTVYIDVKEIDKTAPKAPIVSPSRLGWGKDSVSFTIAMPHRKDVKIAVIESASGYSNFSDKLKKLGYSVDTLLGETNLTILKTYDVVIADEYAWSISAQSHTTLKALYEAGVSVISTGNDNSTNLHFVKSAKQLSSFGNSIPAISKITEYSYMGSYLRVGGDSNAFGITSVIPEADVIMRSGREDNCISIVKLENGVGGEWLHMQSAITYLGSSRHNDEFIMGIIDDLVDYTDDTGISNIEYKINDGNWLPYRGEEITISQEGSYTVYTRATDTSGKTTVSQVNFGIDTSNPSAVISGDKETITGTFTVNLNSIYDRWSGAAEVLISEDSNFSKGVVRSTIEKTSVSKSVPFTLNKITPATSNFGNRKVYIKLIDAVGNFAIYNYTVYYRPAPPNIPTFKNPTNDGLFIESELEIFEWTYSDPNSLPLQKSILYIYNSDKKLLSTFEIDNRETKYHLLLPKGVYYAQVKVFNTFGENSTSPLTMFRVNKFNMDGKFITEDITTTNYINKVMVKTVANIPDKASIVGKIYYMRTPAGQVDTTKFIPFKINGESSILENDVVTLPTTTTFLRVEYTLTRGSSEYLSPEIDQVIVYVR